MMHIKHKQSGQELKVSRVDWEKDPGKYGHTREFWEIIEDGDPVVLCSVGPKGNRTELHLIDREHGQTMVKRNPQKYFIKEMEDANKRPIVPFKKGISYSAPELKDQIEKLVQGNTGGGYDGPDFFKKIAERYKPFILQSLNEKNVKSVYESPEYYFETCLEQFHFFRDLNFDESQIKVIQNEDGSTRQEKFFDAAKANLEYYFKNKGDEGSKYQSLLDGVKNSAQHQLFLEIGKLIAFLDYRAYNKNEWNKYADKRIVAQSNVRQNDWAMGLLEYKKHGNGRTGAKISSSVWNALDFLERPYRSLTILSENHRQKISENLFEVNYAPKDFKSLVASFFEYVPLTPKKEENLFILYSVILYSESIKPLWDKEIKPNQNLHESDDIIGSLQKKITDKNTFLWSDSATKADELGRESLVKSVTKSINELFEKYQDAYTVLLNGEWGAGKSSMLHFFEKHLGETGWEVIRYNAWENQHFNDPWWILINKISKHASDMSLSGEFTSHRFWKFKLQYKHKVFALLLLVAFGVSAYFFTSSVGGATSGDSEYDLGFYSSIVGLVGTFIGAITGLVNNFFYKSVSHEQLKQQFTEHPFEPIRKRFNQIAEENNLAIFIDDLDRCDVDATVALLEGIQNLFKDVRVLYIIAADGQWVSNCFTEKYKSFDNLTNDGCSIGDKFLQKTFQLTLNVPKPNPKYMKLYWDNLIGHEDSKPSGNSQSANKTSILKSTPQERQENYETEIDTLNQETDQELEAQKVEFKENIEKYLRKFLDQGVPENPRQMKRFVNQFEITRQTLVVEGNIEKYGEDDKTVRFLIFSMRYPSLADKLKKGELKIEDLAKTDSSKKPFVDLTKKDRDDIKSLLDGIDEDLIKGDFFSI